MAKDSNQSWRIDNLKESGKRIKDELKGTLYFGAVALAFTLGAGNGCSRISKGISANEARLDEAYPLTTTNAPALVQEYKDLEAANNDFNWMGKPKGTSLTNYWNTIEAELETEMANLETNAIVQTYKTQAELRDAQNNYDGRQIGRLFLGVGVLVGVAGTLGGIGEAIGKARKLRQNKKTLNKLLAEATE